MSRHKWVQDRSNCVVLCSATCTEQVRYQPRNTVDPASPFSLIHAVDPLAQVSQPFSPNDPPLQRETENTGSHPRARRTRATSGARDRRRSAEAGAACGSAAARRRCGTSSAAAWSWAPPRPRKRGGWWGGAGAGGWDRFGGPGKKGGTEERGEEPGRK